MAETEQYPDDLGRMRGRPWVVCAACRRADGKIVLGARHWDPLMQTQAGVDIKLSPEWAEADQGFIDQHGNFLTRREAWKLAHKNGQVSIGKGDEDVILISEDLY